MGTRRRAPPCSNASGSPTSGTAGLGPNSTWPRSTPLGAASRVLSSLTLTGLMPRASQGTSRGRWSLRRRRYKMFLNIPYLENVSCFPFGAILSYPFGQMRSPSFCESIVQLKNLDLRVTFLKMEKPGKLGHMIYHGHGFHDHDLHDGDSHAELARPALY